MTTNNRIFFQIGELGSRLFPLPGHIIPLKHFAPCRRQSTHVWTRNTTASGKATVCGTSSLTAPAPAARDAASAPAAPRTPTSPATASSSQTPTAAFPTPAPSPAASISTARRPTAAPSAPPATAPRPPGQPRAPRTCRRRVAGECGSRLAHSPPNARRACVGADLEVAAVVEEGDVVGALRRRHAARRHGVALGVERRGARGAGERRDLGVSCEWGGRRGADSEEAALCNAPTRRNFSRRSWRAPGGQS